VILEVPKIEGRYYTAQILDEWGEVIANINERSFPTKPYGTFLLVKPGSSVQTPPGAGRIELHSSKAKMLGRVEIKGDAEGVSGDRPGKACGRAAARNHDVRQRFTRRGGSIRSLRSDPRQRARRRAE